MNALPSRRLRAHTIAARDIVPERLFARPEATVFWDGAVALGEAARLEAAGPGRFGDIRRRADALFAELDGPAPPLLGGFAFAPGFADAVWGGFGDAGFILPRWFWRDGLLTYVGAGAPPAAELRALLEPPPEPAEPGADRIERGTRADFTALVAAATREIRAGRAEKIVVARRTSVWGRFDDAGVLARLPCGVTRFAFRRDRATFLGATPERLLGKVGPVLHTEAIAGTSAAATFGDKDRAEHAPVVRAIVEGLAAAGARAEVAPAAPRVLPDLAHLVTPIRARLGGPAHLLDVAAALHPTPAVGGTPRDAALAWIRAHEAPRGWYAGAVGWFDAAGDGELHVALRCALIGAERAILFAGAGIVAASEPDAEYDETVLKERTLLRALGVA
ncbi:MAG TPA: chorismate-binding protein [Haliangiales bacterium]|nr:chorismate-binding protein [Haliangiales bacterium]